MHDETGNGRPGTEALRSQLLSVASSYGYRPIEVPVVEANDLYLLKAGETIAAQLCELVSRKRLSLRPEHTASVVKVFIEQMRDEATPLRLSYVGPIFRWSGGEAAPRQIMEMGVELFGLGGLAGEAELLALASRSLQAVGLQQFQPRIGHVGILQRYLDSLGMDRRLSTFLLTHRQTLREEGSAAVLELLRERLPEFYAGAVEPQPAEERKRLREILAPLEDVDAREVLRDFLSLTQLADSKENRQDDDDIDRLLAKLRRVDSSSQLRKALRFIEELAQLCGEPKHVLAEARAVLREYEQDPQSLSELEALLTQLEQAAVAPGKGWQLDLGLSRGLDYYSGMIFEIFHGEGKDELRMGGGGRYDGLIELFGGPTTPACGFSLGLGFLQTAQKREGSRLGSEYPGHQLVVPEAEWAAAFTVAEKFRDAGVKIGMLSAENASYSDRTIRLQAHTGAEPRFQWFAGGSWGETLDWEETVKRLRQAGGGGNG